ncbi:histidinol-phosphate transaminase [Thauera sp. CAU 1555]|uniref:Histidinol-phosphate aminotransferase n=1 Tax=Thauera sedimentorum TaxID=2767595 RepID=A0ABR9B5H0_9RHOO|nr:histidinol-phosphate transaminase [Thauera sedimentorum]MBC9070712.1 histidinol-phosphate transaminase [Thauera sedimentorum]MBD8501631.1 histidinol-phosphate transaminase [Thauera sedimentorum]
MSAASQAPDYIRAISPYQPGKPISELAREMGIPEASIVKLASNENPLGMGPRAREAALAALSGIERYPDGNGFALKGALSRRLGVAPEQVVLGNGSNDVLELAARAFLAPGRSAVFSQYAFAVYPLAINAVGARGIQVAAKDYGHDLDAMAAAIGPDTRIVFVANPNNPTGTFMHGPELEAFLQRVPQDVLVVLDEAYTEYLNAEQRYDSIAWLPRFPNLLVSRTFSKAYGLAGLRVGYGIAHPDVADLMNRVRQPFNVSSVALAAAEAALGDEEFLAQSARVNERGMAQITEALAELGLEWIPSAGNFVTFRVGEAAAVNASLLRQGVIVRPIASYGMPEWLRVSIGLPEENARFIAALKQALG